MKWLWAQLAVIAASSAAGVSLASLIANRYLPAPNETDDQGDHTAEAPAKTVVSNDHGSFESSAQVRYLAEFLSMRSAADMLDFALFPDSKEITECFAVYNAIRRHLKDIVSSQDSNVTCVVIGDGSSPRCAGLMCFRTRWHRVISVDPQMRIEDAQARRWATIRNLEMHRAKIEDCHVQCAAAERIVIIAIHAHVCFAFSVKVGGEFHGWELVDGSQVCLEESLKSLSFDTAADTDDKPTISVITVPCCNWIKKHATMYGRVPDLQYEDPSMLSGKRRISVFKDVYDGWKQQNAAIASG
ncbi:MAG: hypothetical protein MHM6MM_003673 [Cercozoa sp. M6MM]